jgi:hypothetical protein
MDMTRDATRPFDGEAQIEKTLTSNPLKLYLDVEKDFWGRENCTEVLNLSRPDIVRDIHKS